jgi:FemAB-related protein (PEP-CTERM system-associated)
VTDAPPFDIELTRKAPSGWDAFVRSAAGSSFCHLGGWGTVFREGLGLSPLFLSARRENEIAGILPLFKMPRLGPGHVLVSVPFLNYGGPLGTPEARRTLSIRALEEAVRQGARKLEIRNREASESIPELTPGREKVTVVLPLPNDPDGLFNDTFKAKLRSQIRRPMKEGMEARFGPDQREAFYEVFARNMRDLGTPVLPAAFFSAIADVFPEEADFGVVYHEGEPVAAGAGFHFRGEFEMTWASSLREFNRQAPNMLLYWSFMERCIERGDKTFNFGRCTPGEGTHRFKKQWGGEDEPLHWLQWPESAPAENPEAGVFQMAVKAWQKLPLPLANALGPRLARRIPTF